MKKYLFCLMTLAMMAMVSVSFTACGSDGDDDGGSGSGGINVKELVGRSWYKSETTAGKDNVETKKYSLAFKTQYFATVRISGSGDDKDEHYRWDYGEKDCPFTVNGNVMTIEYNGDFDFKETLTLTFKDNNPVGWVANGLDPNYKPGDVDTPTGAGTAQMFGYYFPKVMKEYGERSVQQGYPVEDYADFRGWRIVDSSNIQVVHMGLSSQDPSRTYNCTILSSQSNGNVNVYYFAFLYAQEEYRYVVQGSKIKLSNGATLDYSNGTLTEKDYTYIKLK